MSYGQSSLRAGDTLHVVKFPDLVRVNPRRLQIQIASGWLTIEGRGMALLYRELLAGDLMTIQAGDVAPGVTVESITTTDRLVAEAKRWHAGECCPVPEDLILLESATSKDYLARSSLSFFGRFGRQSDTFLLGFTDRSYLIEAGEGRSDALASAVLASRFIPGTTNVFTTLGPECFLSWPEFHRHHVATIRETNHRPQDWSGNEFLLTLRFAVGADAPTKRGQSNRTDAGTDSSEIGI